MNEKQERDYFEYKSKNISINLEDFLGFTDKELTFFAFSKRKKYKKIEINKRNGSIRKLYSPVYKLKCAQKIILKEIIYKHISGVLTNNITGFVPGKNIKNNAELHTNKKYILKIDIKDFFPSITQDRVFGLFRTLFNLDYSTSMYLSGICCYNNQLPQGAPTSPMLANLIARFLDYRIIGLLNRYNQKEGLQFTYSRYADDLTFSFNENININTFIGYIINLLLEEGFFPNYDKIGLIGSGKQQKVTGVIVNSKTSVGRKYFKKYKSLFFNISKNGFMQEMIRWNQKNKDKKFSSEAEFKLYLHGIMSFIYNISPDYHKKLLKYKLEF